MWEYSNMENIVLKLLNVLKIDSSTIMCKIKYKDITYYSFLLNLLSTDSCQELAKVYDVTDETITSKLKNSIIKNKPLKARWKPYILSLIGHKVCSSCRAILPFENFGLNNATLTGLASPCNICRGIYNSEYYRTHVEEESLRKRISNSTEESKYLRSQYGKWYRLNFKGTLNAKHARRRAKKLKATPFWSETCEIRELYKNCPKGYHIDHIVPLNHPLVCGLHVLANLQPIPAMDNMKKGNYFKTDWE